MKNELRRQFAAERDNFPAGQRQAADSKITQYFLQAFGNYNSFFVYNSFRSEASTKEIIAALLQSGKRVYCPKVSGKDMLCVPYGKMSAGAFGIMEPEGEPYAGKIDVCVTPLLAVDGQGFRLGYGGGFYDRFFAANDVIRVGIGYAFQQTSTFFRGDFDIPLNYFISERGITEYERQ